MKRLIALIAVILFSASCGKKETDKNQMPPAEAAAIEPAAELAAEPVAVPTDEPIEAADPLVDKVWMLSPEDGRPGVIRIFLSSGAMLQDSCVETFRLSPWRRISDNRIAWNEDGEAIEADVAAFGDSTLTLVLHLRLEEKTESYRLADAHFVCPDMPR
ncbi:MAG: hypothetical protein ACOZAA_02280 [Pseudomonadota bacterium]